MLNEPPLLVPRQMADALAVGFTRRRVAFVARVDCCKRGYRWGDAGWDGSPGSGSQWSV